MTAIEKPAVVVSGPVSAAQTRKSKSGRPPSLRSSPNTTQGTDRWNGLMRSNATTATTWRGGVAEAEAEAKPDARTETAINHLENSTMARFYRFLSSGSLS
ncbi:hypothetical protein GGD41_000986 [Paraburkholderia bryophila]|uniref:Uncharacterized protein n=1 Tax=Paraburkholderia bryophila TaxID=420952 RepID=A0A7Z0AYJ4_9BURK|nr:hypothetical protein [Paraburkholderia bryophila]